MSSGPRDPDPIGTLNQLYDEEQRAKGVPPITEAERRLLAQVPPPSGPPTDHEGDITRLLVTFDRKLDMVIVARITLDGFRIASEDIILQNGRSYGALDKALKVVYLESLGRAEAGNVYARDECIFNYCDAPNICKLADKCRHSR